MKKLLTQLKKVQVKQRGRVIREMNVKCKTLYRSGKCRLEY